MVLACFYDFINLMLNLKDLSSDVNCLIMHDNIVKLIQSVNGESFPAKLEKPLLDERGPKRSK